MPGSRHFIGAKQICENPQSTARQLLTRDSFTSKIMSHLLVTGLTPESLQMEPQTALKGNTKALQAKDEEANFLLLHYSESVLLPGAKDMFLRKIS